MSWSWPHRHRRRREDDTPLGWRAITHAMRRLGLDTSIIDHQPGVIGSGRLTVAADGPRITVNADMAAAIGVDFDTMARRIVALGLAWVTWQRTVSAIVGGNMLSWWS